MRYGLFIFLFIVMPARGEAIKPWWVEVGVGRGEVEVVGHDRRELVAQALAAAGINAVVQDAGEPDDTDTRLLGFGYRFNPYLGINAAFHDLGSTEGNFIAVSGADTLGGNLDSDYRAISVAAIGYWPPLRWLSLQGKLGLHHWQHQFRVRGTLPTTLQQIDQRIEDSGTNILYGAGLGFSATRWLGFDLYWERFQGVEDEAGIDVKSLRVVIKFP